MTFRDCPGWEYSGHPNRRLIAGRVELLLIELARGSLSTSMVARDTREAHGQVFFELTPPDCDYYAGHYRGEAFRCLEFYLVRIPNDSRVGARPGAVGFLMTELSDSIHAGLQAIDRIEFADPREQLRYAIELASRAFVSFLTIHPYANGNGHAARLIVWCLLGRYGYWPKRLPVEPRPPDPPYTEMIARFRDGESEPLEKYLLQSLSD